MKLLNINAYYRHHNKKRCIYLLSFILLISLVLMLDGCSMRRGRKIRSYDHAPTRHVDYQRIPDAIPKRDNFHPYGTRDYTVKRKRYKALKGTKGYVKRGYASWYGTSFHGRHTSTQEVYNLYAMTAASPELPLPCYAEVTNLANGKHIIVKVNDRGPFYGKRILDLSYAAAQRLGFANQGIAYVQVVALGEHNWDYQRNAPKKHAVFLRNHTYHFGSHRLRHAENKIDIDNPQTMQSTHASKLVQLNVTPKPDADAHVNLITKTAAASSTKQSTVINASVAAIEDKSFAATDINHAAKQAVIKTNSQHRQPTAKPVIKIKHPVALDCIKAPMTSKLAQKRTISNPKWVQVATFGKIANAHACQHKLQHVLKAQTVFIHTYTQQALYSVRIGPVDASELPVLLDRIRSAGFKPLVIVKNSSY